MEVDEKDAAPADAAIGELVARLSDDTVRLVRDEIRLARAEMAQKAKAAGVGAGLFGGAGVFVVYGFGLLVAAAVTSLSIVVVPWGAALIVAAVLFVLACTAALMGTQEFGRAAPPFSTEAMQSTREDVDELKRGLHT
jgi:uncharacterized membrane protein YqjE